MKFSTLFTKTKKDIAKTDSVNAELLIRGGFVDQLSAGVYTYLPLGLRVLRKIENIIRDEMNKAGGQELLMPAMHPKWNWQQTGRWDSLDVLFKVVGQLSGDEMALGPTHEEVITPLASKFMFSYKDLPKYVYQIQDKFRDEARPKSGLLRTREFLMKDLYSFHTDEKDLDKYYTVMEEAYSNIFASCGIGKETVLTYASGGSFSKYSHEYQTICETGEDTIYLCAKCNVAVNKEIITEQKTCPECGNKALTEKKAIEVGNIFKLKDKFSKAFGFKYTGKDNKEKYVEMGCYGIGLGRVLATIVEVSHDDRGIIWPESVAPYDVHLVDINGTKKETKEIHKKLTEAGLEVLWDDREESAGVKLSDADLLGIPERIVVSSKTIKAGKIELKKRDSDKEELLSLADYLKRK
ncbi:MAG: His/Gly/Thr/Pro-type tRNA ligase C-terminal domain-containing protein [Patescibacteria group bacterium]|nr:His/Gly/Thr/Pro-type tRNA ligase C-terminal domain-containing protein [Patescibacteria group bacterium]